jgi:hypothetical protein
MLKRNINLYQGPPQQGYRRKYILMTLLAKYKSLDLPERIRCHLLKLKGAKWVAHASNLSTQEAGGS